MRAHAIRSDSQIHTYPWREKEGITKTNLVWDERGEALSSPDWPNWCGWWRCSERLNFPLRRRSPNLDPYLVLDVEAVDALQDAAPLWRIRVPESLHHSLGVLRGDALQDGAWEPLPRIGSAHHQGRISSVCSRRPCARADNSSPAWKCHVAKDRVAYLEGALTVSNICGLGNVESVYERPWSMDIGVSPASLLHSLEHRLGSLLAPDIPAHCVP